MNEYQKENINMLLRREWEAHLRHFAEAQNPLASEEDKRRHEIRSYEALGYANGMRQALEMLGYSTRYDDHTIPQIV